MPFGSPTPDGIPYRQVGFPSQDATLRGRLYLHADSRPPPTVVMTHGFSATITNMVADRYAERLHAAGLQVLLFDHRGFGISGGHPRQVINRWLQARAYSDAIDFLEAGHYHMDPARIAIWGDSLSGAMAIGDAAFDPRVRALVVQVPACGPELPPTDPDGSRFEGLRDAFHHADLNAEARSTTGPMPVVSGDQQHTRSLLTPSSVVAWFTHHGNQRGTLWINEATVLYVSTRRPSTPDCARPTSAARRSVSSRETTRCRQQSREVTIHADRAAPEPRVLLEIDGGHFGLLQPDSALFDEVTRAQITFMTERRLPDDSRHCRTGGSTPSTLNPSWGGPLGDRGYGQQRRYSKRWARGASHKRCFARLQLPRRR